MRRAYRELGKPFAVRTVELAQALQLIAESLIKIRAGETRYMIVLSGQSRSLVAERSKGETPLLLEVAAKFDVSLDVYCMPGVDDPTFPTGLKKDIFLHVSGFPVTLQRQLEAQRRMQLKEFLDQELIQFKGIHYSPRTVIEWYANKAGGSHYSSKIPEDFAALLALNLMNLQPLANLLVQIGEAVLAAGRELLRSAIELEIYALVVVPAQENGAIQEVNYLFDSKYEGSEMRLCISLNSRLIPSFFAAGLQGAWARVDCDRLIDWSQPRLIHATLAIEDDLSTTLELAVDGVRVGQKNIKTPLFVLSDPLNYDSYHNKSFDGPPQNFRFGVASVVMIGRELGPADHANMLLYTAIKRAEPDLKAMVFSPQAFGLAAKGTKNLTITGRATLQLVRELLKPPSSSDA